jgi:uncharacterized membrane protein YhaH (DUF805 family)
MNQEMSPVDWAKRPILEKYADFSGRAPRAEYWWYVLALVVAYIVVAIIEGVLGIHRIDRGYVWPDQRFALAGHDYSFSCSRRAAVA